MGSGVSLAVAKRFGREGFPIAMIARRAESLAKSASALAEAGVSSRAYTADAADAAALSSALGRVAADIGPVGVLVYNAAVMHTNPLLELGSEELLGTLRVNVVGALVAAQAVIPAMRVAGEGTILLTGGGFAMEPIPSRAALGVGKAAIRNLGFSLFTECRPAGIHVGTVTIWGVIDSAPQFAPDRVAETYWALHAQRPEAFEREVVIR
jgi:short-subunit dehydrogenase